MFDVRVSSTFARQFRDLPRAAQTRIRAALEALREDPFKARSGADIKVIKATEPQKHRVRVGTYRAVYAVEGKQVLVIEVFARERGNRE